MLRLLHRLLTRNRITSRLQRALVHRVKELIGFQARCYSVGSEYAEPSAIENVINYAKHRSR
jgi:hypothetical protein